MSTSLNQAPGPRRLRVPSRTLVAIANIILSSHVVLGSFIADNWGLYEFAAHHLLPSAVVWIMGVGLLLVLQKREGNVDAAGISLSVGAVVALGGGSLSAMLGPFGLVLVPAAVVLTYRAVKDGFPTRTLTRIANLVLGGLLILAAYWFGPGTMIPPETQPITQVDATTGSLPPVAASRPDVYFLILDELASTDTAPLDVSALRELDQLRVSGFRIEGTSWAGYTVSAASIAAILDGAYHVMDGEYLDSPALRRLGAVSRGDNRLFKEAQAGGYHVTMVESGLWMTACESNIDHCVESGVFDEAMGILLAQSVAGWWYRNWWGDAMVQAGLRSMRSAEKAMLALAENGRPDLLFAHILLPHVPYVLGSDCELHGRTHESYTSHDERQAAYRSQADCVLTWLRNTIEVVDDASEVTPAVVVVGDHGTNFAGQLTLPLNEWGTQEIAERLAAFSATRMPQSCPVTGIDATPQVTVHLISCLWGGSNVVPPRHFLVSYGDDPPQAAEYPHHRLTELE